MDEFGSMLNTTLQVLRLGTDVSVAAGRAAVGATNTLVKMMAAMSIMVYQGKLRNSGKVSPRVLNYKNRDQISFTIKNEDFKKALKSIKNLGVLYACGDLNNGMSTVLVEANKSQIMYDVLRAHDIQVSQYAMSTDGKSAIVSNGNDIHHFTSENLKNEQTLIKSRGAEFIDVEDIDQQIDDKGKIKSKNEVLKFFSKQRDKTEPEKGIDDLTTIILSFMQKNNINQLGELEFPQDRIAVEALLKEVLKNNLSAEILKTDLTEIIETQNIGDQDRAELLTAVKLIDEIAAQQIAENTPKLSETKVKTAEDFSKQEIAQILTNGQRGTLQEERAGSRAETNPTKTETESPFMKENETGKKENLRPEQEKNTGRISVFQKAEEYAKSHPKSTAAKALTKDKSIKER